MKSMGKSASAILISFVLCCCSFMFFACENNDGGLIKEGTFFVKGFEKHDGFSVNFIDVSDGDAIFINFGDGVTMLIDCGEKGQNNVKSIKEYLGAYCNGTLDYLLLTHTDADHIGNAESILEEVKVKTAFLPDIIMPQRFPVYEKVENAISKNGANIVRSAVGCSVIGEDYTLVFLTPNANGTTDSAYAKVNAADDPLPAAINDISPIVYLEYKGVRFLFTGDAGFSQEKVALDNIKFGITDGFLQRENAVNIEDTDFLKVSHHGSDDASGADFLQKVRPQCAVISVNGNNYYGLPATQTVKRIYEYSPDCEILRTSETGTISVCVSESGAKTVFVRKNTAV